MRSIKMSYRDDFAVFILSHGRADNLITVNTLKKQGYTGKIYILCDDEDKTLEEYKKKFGKSVLVFNKQDAIEFTDSADNTKKRNSVVYARNYVYKAAKEVGVKYILVLDDDYTGFYNYFNEKKEYITKNTTIKNLDGYIKTMLNFFIESKIDCLAMSQGGDFIGGEGGVVPKKHTKGKMSRKAMNAFFLDVDNPLYFFGRINEDVNMYVRYGQIGKKIFTYARCRLEQKTTQTNRGGLTDIYLDLGTYIKSFYSVMYAPSCVKLIKMGVKNKRIHHSIKWKNTTPMILDEKYKK